MYSRDQIDQVRTSVNIVDVIREYVPSLKAAGRSVRGLCPFHNEKTPSFHVHPDKGLFKCFGCGESGDVIAFVSKLEQAPFSEVLERLATQAGIRLVKQQSSQHKEVESQRDKLHRLLESALHFYEEQLWTSSGGREARTYLKKRHVSEETTRKFRLGYAPSTGSGAFEYLVKKGFPINLCQQAGLVAQSSKGRYYDPLYGRLVFSIFDNFGHVIGFGGRILPISKKKVLDWGVNQKDDGGPKYINTSETPVFSKGRQMYGLHQAKPSIMSKRQAVVLEGYMDVIGAHQSGFTSVVATLGTALTRDHARLLKRYADEVVAFFDPDEAGQKATLRGLVPLLQEQLFAKVVISAEALDPDEWINKHGLDAFDNLINEAPDFLDFLIQTKLSKDTMSLAEKNQAIREILDILSASSNEILKVEWTQRLGRVVGIRPEILEQERKKKETRQPGQSLTPIQMRSGKKNFQIPTAELEYLLLIINHSELWNEIHKNVVELKEPRQAKVLEIILEQLNRDGKLSLPAIHDQLPKTDQAWFLKLTLEERHFSDPLERRDQLIRDIRIKHDKERLDRLSQQVKTGTASAQEQNEYVNLLRRIKGSQSTQVAH